MKPKFMNIYTLILIRISVFPNGIFEISNHDNEVLAIISFRYTISNLQTPETLQFSTRGWKRSDVKTCFSARQNAKNEPQLQQKNHVCN